MARPKRWVRQKFKDGILEISFSSWRYFQDYIQRPLLDYSQFIFRGQSSENWKLEPTLDRFLRKHGKLKDRRVRNEHLQSFKYAIRGRRGPNPPTIENDNDWWALGQHHGLATPLLDWTETPFAALYFAFYAPDKSETENRVVYALSRPTVEHTSARISTRHKGKSRPPLVEIIRPLSDENSRLVSQRGLFTRAPDGVTVEEWMRNNCKSDEYVHLIIMRIPDKQRDKCLQSLNRMNINHLSLFPDLFGAAKYCNLDLSIPD